MRTFPDPVYSESATVSQTHMKITAVCVLVIVHMTSSMMYLICKIRVVHFKVLTYVSTFA